MFTLFQKAQVFFLAALILTIRCVVPSCAEPMVFVDKGAINGCPSCIAVEATGEITTDTPERFRKLIESKPIGIGIFSARMVWLDSPGGDLKAALELGRLFRKHRIQAWTGMPNSMGGLGTCQSACAYAFLGAADRIVTAPGMEEAKGARTTLGFHQFFDSDLLSKREQAAFTGVDRIKDQYVVGVLIEYLIEMKIHTDLYTVASETPPGEMHFLTNEEAVRFGVVEGDQPFKQAALQDSIGYQWQILPYGDGLRLELSAGDRGERIFCMTREPNMVHVQLLRRTPDGSTFVDTDYASGDLRDYLGNIHKPSAELESGAIVPVVFGGLFGDSEGDFSFLLDLKFSLEAFHQLSRDTSFVIMPQDEPEHGPASVRTGSGVLLMDVLSGVLPHNGRSDLLKLMRKNCA